MALQPQQTDPCCTVLRPAGKRALKHRARPAGGTANKSARFSHSHPDVAHRRPSDLRRPSELKIPDHKVRLLCRAAQRGTNRRIDRGRRGLAAVRPLRQRPKHRPHVADDTAAAGRAGVVGHLRAGGSTAAPARPGRARPYGRAARRTGGAAAVGARRDGLWVLLLLLFGACARSRCARPVFCVSGAPSIAVRCSAQRHA
jgi:hypothetical protein